MSKKANEITKKPFVKPAITRKDSLRDVTAIISERKGT